jgi:hypothetical protein
MSPGVSVFSGSQLGAKHIGLLHDLVPTSKAMGLLVNPRNAKQTEAQIELIQPAARALGIELSVVRASGENDLAQAFATLSGTPGQCVDRRRRSPVFRPSQPDHCSRRTAQDAGGLCISRIRSGWWSDELWP